MTSYPGPARKPLTGPEKVGRKGVRWLSAAALLVSFAALGAAAGGAAVAFTSTAIGWDELADFIMGAAVGTGLAIVMAAIIIMRAPASVLAVVAAAALLLAGLVAGGIWLRLRAEAPSSISIPNQERESTVDAPAVVP